VGYLDFLFEPIRFGIRLRIYTYLVLLGLDMSLGRVLYTRRHLIIESVDVRLFACVCGRFNGSRDVIRQSPSHKSDDGDRKIARSEVLRV
jgi:hypothetical protein